MANDGDDAGANADPIPVPQAQPIVAPTWVMVVGAASGLVTLAGFFAFAFLSATNPDLACNAFTFLAPIFAFGAALAVSFIGGAAAVSGQLGIGIRRHAIGYSAGGGVAVFFIAFLLFQQFQPARCLARDEATLRLMNITQGTAVAALSDVWQRREDDMPNRRFSMRYLITRSSGEGSLEVTPPDGGEGCRIHVDFVADLDVATGAQAQFAVHRSAGNGSEVTLHYTLRPSGNPTKAVPSCFTIDTVPVVGYLAVSPKESGAVFGTRPADHLGGVEGDELAAVGDAMRMLGALVVSPAFAQERPLSFSELRDQLLGPDLDSRVGARQYLSVNFDAYQQEIVAEVLNPEAPGGDYLASLLSALISGIDQATEGQFEPGTDRDLSLALPFIAGSEARIVDLTAHQDAAVRKQARRLIQRFPVNAFADVYAPLLASAAQGSCNIATTPTESQAIIYSSIFYTYNRIIQTAVTGLTTEDAEAAETSAEATLAATACLDEELRVDGALVYFGLSTIYGESGFAEESRANAVKFLDTVEGSGGTESYYFQTHVDLMEQAGS